MRFHDPAAAARHAGLLTQLVKQMKRHRWTEIPCVVCGASDNPVAYVKWGVQMRECDGCKHLYTSPRMPESAVGELYGSYYWDQYQVAIGSPSLQERMAFDYHNGNLKITRDILPWRTSGTMLDIGASGGGFVAQAVENGFDAAGLEPSEEICQRARQALGVRMYAGTLAEQQFPDGRWDIITLYDVLEHLFEPVRDLAEMHRVLAPDGLLVIETPTSTSTRRRDLGVEWSTISPIEHVHLFSEQNIDRVLRETGFQVLDLYSPNEDNWLAVATKV